MGMVRKGDSVFIGQAFMQQQRNGTTVVLTEAVYHCDAEYVRAVDIVLEDKRVASKRRAAAAAARAAGGGRGRGRGRGLAPTATRPELPSAEATANVGDEIGREYKLASGELERILSRLPC